MSTSLLPPHGNGNGREKPAIRPVAPYRPSIKDFEYLKAAYAVLDAGGQVNEYALSVQVGKASQTVYQYFQVDPRRWDWLLEHLGVKPEHRASAYQRALRVGLRKASIPHLDFCAKVAGWYAPTPSPSVTVNQQANTVNLTQIVIQHDAAPPDFVLPDGNGNGHHG